MLAEEVAVIFLNNTTEKLQSHDQEDDSDAGAGEHAGGSNVPCLADEAGIDGVPVPKHLRNVYVSTRAESMRQNKERAQQLAREIWRQTSSKKLTLILQACLSPMPIPIPISPMSMPMSPMEESVDVAAGDPEVMVIVPVVTLVVAVSISIAMMLICLFVLIILDKSRRYLKLS